MEKLIVISATDSPAAGEMFYHLIDRIPESEADWTDRQATLRSWRSDPRFESYWPAIDHMLTVDFASFRRKAAAMEAIGPLEDYDYDAWRKLREYDLKHAHDHMP